MPKKKQPENIQWVVTGRVTYSGASCIVHAKTRDEALTKANAGDNIGGIDVANAETVDWEFNVAQADVDGDD